MLHGHAAGSEGEVNHRRWDHGRPSLRVSARPGRCPMTTTAPAVLIPVAPVFTDTERLALAGFLAGYSGLTRQAYELDLRQYATWDPRPRPGHHYPAAMHHRRVLPVRGGGRPARSLPGRACPPPPAVLRVPCHRAGPQRTRRAAGRRRARLADRARAAVGWFAAGAPA